MDLRATRIWTGVITHQRLSSRAHDMHPDHVEHGHMTRTVQPARTTTTAFYVQSILSFGVSVTALALGIAYLPVTAWVRAFLSIGLLYVVTSTFTLAKCVRDRQEETSLVGRVDQARLDKLLAEHDPFKVD
jgi:hypothetical protein